MDAIGRDFTAASRQFAAAGRRRRSLVAGALRSGWTQRALATELRCSQPEVRRLASMSAARDAAGAPRRWMTARDVVEAVRTDVAPGDTMAAFRTVMQGLDHARALTDEDDLAEWAVTPLPMRDPRFDVVWQALVRRTFVGIGRPVPAWADPHALDEPWVLASDPVRIPRVLAHADHDLARDGIFISAQDLVTA